MFRSDMGFIIGQILQPYGTILQKLSSNLDAIWDYQ